MTVSVQWVLASAVALALHLAGFWWATSASDKTAQVSSFSTGSGENGVEVGLGMEGSYQNLMATKKQKHAQPELEEVIEPEPAKEIMPEPEPIIEQKQPAEVKPKKIEAKPAKPDLSPQIKTSEPVKASGVKVVKAEVNEQTPDLLEQKKPEKKDKRPEDKADSPALQQATGFSKSRKAGGKQASVRDYFSNLKGLFQQLKHYPSHLKKQKIQGTTVLSFTILKSGEIVKGKIKKTSGNTELDQAALDLLAKANPLPPLPDSFKKQEISISIPVEFSLITK